jgi:ATP-dependent Clp protease ATP-binding subunit ClpB
MSSDATIVIKRRDVMVAEMREEETKSKSCFFLDPRIMGQRAQEFHQNLEARIIGQDNAVDGMSGLYQLFIAGLNQTNRPLGTLLFLGPTGTGKTRVVEAAAEVLFNDPNAVIKIDCAEFQHSHEIAKLVGSPPGYLGHRETSARLAQENLDRFHTEENPFSIVLFDEIEKASDSLWQLLLGILDKATLTLGDNRHVDFSRSVIVMTSNLGAREISELQNDRIGFTGKQLVNLSTEGENKIDKKIHQTAVKAASRNFSPEFMNRLDKVVVFNSLNQQQLRQILELELRALQDRISCSASRTFVFSCSDAVKEMLLREGVDHRYGARHLKRSINRLLVLPLSNLVASGQVNTGDSVYVDLNDDGKDVEFSKQPGETAVSDPAVAEAAVAYAGFFGAGAQIQQARAII